MASPGPKSTIGLLSRTTGRVRLTSLSRGTMIDSAEGYLGVLDWNECASSGSGWMIDRPGLRSACRRTFRHWTLALVSVCALTLVASVPSMAWAAGSHAVGTSHGAGGVHALALTSSSQRVPRFQPEDTSSHLNSVSCTSSSFCMAVGGYTDCPTYCNIYYGATETHPGLIETWDGNTWSIVPSPVVNTALGLHGVGFGLAGVSCTSSTFCMAVGSNGVTSGADTLVESWDGSTWTVVPSPNADNVNGLISVSCSGPTFCMAVGNSSATSISNVQNLVESWDGSSWSIIPGPPASDGTPNSVACTSPSFCLAVGDQQTGGTASQIYAQSFAETWDGSSWTIISSPDPDPLTNVFASVSCLTSTNCVAAGYQGNLQLFAESWNGTVWSAAPGPGSYSGRVSCSASPTFCMVISNVSETWDGTTWTTVSSPAPGTALSCTGPTFCMAVGSVSGQTLAETWNGTTWTVLASPNANALNITSTSLPNGTVHSEYSGSLTASGGNPPYKWKLAPGSGPLPKGLKLNKTTGVIGGVPKYVGTSTFTVVVIDTKSVKTAHPPRVQNSASGVFSITIS